MYKYAVKKKNMENIDEMGFLIIEKDGKVFDYKIANTYNKLFDIEIDHDRKYDGINYHKFISSYKEYTTDLGVHIIAVYM